VLAFKHHDRDPVILTNDAEFASVRLGDHDLPEISLQHVE
jgi:hypothetical protein